MKLDRQVFGDPANKGKVISREEAITLLDEWVLNDRLKLHMYQVAHLMRCWAIEKMGADDAEAWRWEMAGLLHDADWDQWPEQHCRKIINELERRQVDPEVLHAIASHGPAHFGVDPVSEMDKMLFAFDELSGFIHAYSLMRPEGYQGMEIKGVKKRLKDRAFAAAVSREEIADAIQRAGMELDQLIAFIISNQGDRATI